MLSLTHEDDDDDNHLCIKCNLTITGLENYVKHRKEKCGKKYEPVVMQTSDPFNLTSSLGADLFFQSLELQSSAKKTTLSQLTPPITSRKSTQMINPKQLSMSRDLSTMSPLRGEDWIGGHSLRIGTSDDNQTNLINAVASISGVSKKDITTSPYNLENYDYKDDEVSDCACEDSEEDDEDDAHATGGKWKPSPHHTGGKWRPATPEDWDLVNNEQEHTGGKWKPIMPDAIEKDEDYSAPPPDHTKGKWVPGTHEHKTQIMQTTIQTKKSLHYWCGPCNRRLASKPIYEKHLQSNLHMKKVTPEHDLEFSGLITPHKITKGKRDIKVPQYLSDSIYEPQRKRNRSSVLNINENIAKKKQRKHVYTHCAGCKSKVKIYLMGKHLISHYHIKKASGIYDQLILDNINAIVHQSPFQCSPCKFYTNWSANFLKHWLSDDHINHVNTLEGVFWCSFCKFECTTTQEMYTHMTSLEHNEVIAAINRSMPIIIRKKTIFKCGECPKIFKFNIEAKRHSDTAGHKLLHTASDVYQEFSRCHCGKKFKCSLTLAGHLKTKHKQNVYHCIVCSLSFQTSKDVLIHRRSVEHKIKKQEKLKLKGVPVKDLKRKCPYCVDVVMDNVLELKTHIQTEHPDLKKSCPKCGMTFLLPQEVSWHIRNSSCQIPSPDPTTTHALWRCSQCAFTTDSHAECFFHEILHTEPITKIVNSANRKRKIEIYDCPFCSKAFSKTSLRHHLRQHTLERPYLCTICNANFIRISSLTHHVKKFHESVLENRVCTCQKCDQSFDNEVLLLEHSSHGCASFAAISTSADRKFKCNFQNCTYLAATSTHLARHARTHGEILKKYYECPLCPYKTYKTSQIKRHKRSHEGAKPYFCPHCDFTCGTLENLRKHVLRSHPDTFLYSCRDCDNYKTSMARDLRVHLTAVHKDKYNYADANETVKNYLMAKN